MKIWQERPINLLHKLSLCTGEKQSDGCCSSFQYTKTFTPLRIVDKDLFRRNNKSSSALNFGALFFSRKKCLGLAAHEAGKPCAPSPLIQISLMRIIIRLYRRRGSFLLRDQKEPKVLINPTGAFVAHPLPTLKNRERLFLLVYAY